MNATRPPEKPEQIFYSPSLGLASTNRREGDIEYVPKDVADQYKEQRDNLIKAIEAVDNHEDNAWEHVRNVIKNSDREARKIARGKA